jgi:hypothetical protein
MSGFPAILFVIPAKAGLHPAPESGSNIVWTPAFAGVTE